MLTREAILGVDDLKRVESPVPEWGGSVYVRTMTGGERDQHDQIIYRRNQANGEPIKNIRATLLAFTVCDEAGKLLFTATDIESLGNKSGAAIDRLYEVARQVNKVTDADVEELKGN